MVSCFWSVKEKLHLNKAFKLLAVLLGSRWRGYYSWVMLNPANQTGCMSFRLRRTYWRVQVHWSAMLHWSVGMFYFFFTFPIRLCNKPTRCRASAFSVFTLPFSFTQIYTSCPSCVPGKQANSYFFFPSVWQESDYGSWWSLERVIISNQWVHAVSITLHISITLGLRAVWCDQNLTLQHESF